MNEILLFSPKQVKRCHVTISLPGGLFGSQWLRYPASIVISIKQTLELTQCEHKAPAVTWQSQSVLLHFFLELLYFKLFVFHQFVQPAVLIPDLSKLILKLLVLNFKQPGGKISRNDKTSPWCASKQCFQRQNNAMTVCWMSWAHQEWVYWIKQNILNLRSENNRSWSSDIWSVQLTCVFFKNSAFPHVFWGKTSQSRYLFRAPEVTE